jgi:hypothetical protein
MSVSSEIGCPRDDVDSNDAERRIQGDRNGRLHLVRGTKIKLSEKEI